MCDLCAMLGELKTRARLGKLMKLDPRVSLTPPLG